MGLAGDFSAFVALLWALSAPVLLALRDLGHDEYRVREAASARLVEYVEGDGGAAVFWVLKLAERYSTDAEVVVRARIAARHFPRLTIEEFAFIPWIDMLPDSIADRQELIARYTTCARRFTDGGEGWPEYRAATALYLRDLANSGRPRSEVRGLVLQMMEREVEYHGREDNR